ncbi:hypothetical protein [Streptomyces griseosporeus]|uniref:hypothetical protein n=1 Tax=Streptomyces griseosporeus TaxID=1910 RepID=UPI00370003A6
MVKKEPERGAAGRGLLVLEVVFVLVAVGGLALWSVPGALLVGGALGVLACERAATDRRTVGAGKEAGGEGP